MVGLFLLPTPRLQVLLRSGSILINFVDFGVVVNVNCLCVLCVFVFAVCVVDIWNE
jgi:hypothetical protein